MVMLIISCISFKNTSSVRIVQPSYLTELQNDPNMAAKKQTWEMMVRRKDVISHQRSTMVNTHQSQIIPKIEHLVHVILAEIQNWQRVQAYIINGWKNIPAPDIELLEDW